MMDFADTDLAADFDGQDWEGDWYEQPEDDGWSERDDWDSDVDHDAYVLASAGWGTDEDYGFFGADYDPPF